MRALIPGFENTTHKNPEPDGSGVGVSQSVKASSTYRGVCQWNLKER